MRNARHRTRATRGVVIAAAVAVAAIALGGCATTTSDTHPDSTHTPSLTAGLSLDEARWVSQAATVCPAVSAPLLAAVEDTESGFVATTQSVAGTRGVAQLTSRQWAQFGADDDRNGTPTPADVGDATMTLARVLCSLSVDHPDRDGLLAAYYGGPAGAAREDYVSHIAARTAVFETYFPEGQDH